MYKWTDEQGNIHYGEQPPNYQQAQNIAPPPPPGSSPESSSERINALRKGILKQTKDKAEAKQEAGEKAAHDKKVSAYCLQLNKRIASFQSKPRIRQKDKEGNYSYLADEQKQKQQKEMQQNRVKHCS